MPLSGHVARGRRLLQGPHRRRLSGRVGLLGPDLARGAARRAHTTLHAGSIAPQPDADDLDLLPFHDGSFKIASKTGCAIIPMALNNTVEIFEAHFPKIKSTHVVLEYGEPIYVKDLSREDQKHLGAYTQNILHDMLEKNKPLV